MTMNPSLNPKTAQCRDDGHMLFPLLGERVRVRATNSCGSWKENSGPSSSSAGGGTFLKRDITMPPPVEPPRLTCSTIRKIRKIRSRRNSQLTKMGARPAGRVITCGRVKQTKTDKHYEKGCHSALRIVTTECKPTQN